jgi:hypothetical protein
VRIAELVPEISELFRLPVGAFKIGMIAAGGLDNAAEHRQMRGMRLVESGDERVDHSQRPFVRDHEARPAFARSRHSMFVGHGLERANDRRAHRDDAMSAAPCGVDPLRCFR